MSRLGPWEIILILVVVLFIFGVGKLPEAAKSIGKAIYELKKSLRDDPAEIENKPPDRDNISNKRHIKTSNKEAS